MATQNSEFFNPEEIVISGISGVFPNSENVAEFRDNLFAGKDMVSNFDRHNRRRRTGLLKTIDRFDHSFFHVTHPQVQGMLIASRLLLEKSFEAILDAGYNPQQIRGRNIGVICGVWDPCNEGDPASITEDTDDYALVLGRSKFMIPNRISFCLDVKGPSVSMNTACSSSMYAFDYAFHAIKNGRCEAAIVIAPNLCLSELGSYHLSSMMASTDITAPFDANTQGYTKAEAAVAIFLQKRKDARRVYANVIHTKVNCEGFKDGGTSSPSIKMQKQLYREFYEEVGINPLNICYFEAHGTGTQAGDVVEGTSIDEFFSPGRQTPLKIGAVKSNMGHAEAAAALCSVVKMVLAFESGLISPNLHFKNPNPKIKGLIDGRLQVVTELTPLEGQYHAISSFGAGGAIGHTVLTPHHKIKKSDAPTIDELPRLITVSGRTKEAVDCILNELEKNINDAEYIGLLHEIFSDQISGHLYRGYVISNKDEEPAKSTEFFSGDERPIWFVFCGMGSQWPSMGKSLMQIPIFAKSIQKCHDVLSPKGIDLIKIVTDDDPQTLDNILHCFVGIAAIQIALVDILTSLDVKPDGIIGHSVGELGCAYADGCFTAEQMILAAYYRGLVSLKAKLIPGTMAAVGEGYATMKDMVPSEIDIACHNSSSNCTISGPTQAVKNFSKTLLEKNIFVREVNSANIAYHSRYIKPVGTLLESNLKTIIPEPKLRSERWICTSALEQEWNSEAVKYSSAQYHTNNLLNPVYFEESCRHIPSNAIAIEIGPHGLLNAILKRSLPPTVENITLSMRNHGDGVYFLLNALGRMYEVGCVPKLSNLYPPVEFPVSRSTPMISPLIKWQHDEQWPIGKLNQDISITGERNFTINTKKNDFAFVADHIVDGVNLYPGIGYLILVWKTVAAMKNKKMINVPIVFENVRFERATIIPKTNAIRFRVVVRMGTHNFEVNENQAVIASGIVRVPENVDKEFDEMKSRNHEINNPDILPLNSKDFYKELRLRGYNYKGYFRNVTYANVEGTRGKILWNDNFVTFIDSMAQISALQFDCRELLVPTFIRKLTINAGRHLEILKNLDQEKPEFPVALDPLLGLVSSGGIQMKGWKMTEIARRKDTADVVLQKYQFIPYIDNEVMDVSLAARLCTQIALENVPLTTAKTCELFDQKHRFEISTSILNALRDMPQIEANINVLTNTQSLNEIQTPDNITVLNETLPQDKSSLLVVISNLSDKTNNLAEIFEALMDDGFIIAIESLSKDLSFEKLGLNVCFSRPINDHEKFLLLNRANKNLRTAAVIKVKNESYSWLSEVQKTSSTIKSIDEKMVLYSEKEPTSGILGFFNCLKWEKKGSVSRCFFMIDVNAPAFSFKNPFYQIQFYKNLSHNTYKDGKWGCYRHLPTQRTTVVKTPHTLCTLAERGNLASFKWMEGSLDPFTHKNTDGKSIAHVYFSSLNFKDIMMSVRKFSPTELSYYSRFIDGHEGIEFSGRDGHGERIMGILKQRGIASVVETIPGLTWKVPDNMTLEEAASIPVVYTTMIYAFFFKSNLKRGSSILIHAGSGGIGQAAINICLHYGCKIFTTVGTAEKVEFIRKTYPQIPADHIASTRDTSFENLIKEKTNGRGVDMVLNSLAGEKLQASLRCVAKRGVFLELGKFDMTRNNPLELGHFLNEITFISVQVDLHVWDINDTVFEIQKKVQEMLDNGIIKPIKRTVFQMNEVESAFRYMAGGKHIGKVVIKIRDEEKDLKTKPAIIHFSAEARVSCEDNKSYIIVGGLGGFGLELVDWLILRGARNVILSSRTGIRKGYQSYRIKLWRSYGVKVAIFTEDITKEKGVENLLLLANSIGSVAGIFNVAVILQDNPISEQTEDSFRTAVGPKADVVTHLDKLSRKMCPKLEYFVAFSSIASGFGNLNQTNYAFANSIMERICEIRQAENLPALAIQWGAIGEVGIVADFAEDNISLVIGGTLQQKIKSCLETLNLFMKQKDPIVTSMIVAEKRQNEGDIINAVANILGIKDLKSISPSWTLPELGMDSILAIELKQIIESEFNMFFTPEDLRNMTFAKLYTLKNENEKEQSKSGQKIITQMDYFLNENLMTNPVLRIPFDTHKNEGGTNEKGPAVFLFPGIEGIALTMEPLVKNMNIQALCFQYLYEKKENLFQKLYESYSKVILESLKEDQEFNIIGYSFGGLFAMEVVNILEKAGRKGRIWLIESSPLQVKKMIIEHFGKISITNKQSLQNHVCATLMGILCPKLVKEKFIENLAMAGDWEAKKKFCFSMLPSGTAKENAVLQIFDRIYATYKHTHTFQVSPVKMKTQCVLIRCVDDKFNLDEAYGLSEYFKNPVQVHQINANHVSILMNPNTAQIIMRSLNLPNTESI